MVTTAKYIPPHEVKHFNDYCSNEGWHDPACPWCTSGMEVCALRCRICGGEWRDGKMTKGKDKKK